MNFVDWLIYRGLSTSSAEKYVGAIEGPLSSWAIDSNLTAGPLTAFTSPTSFGEVALQIRSLPIFLERNERGHNMYSSALTKFAEYLGEGYVSDVESDIEAILNDTDLSKTERLNLVKSRIGQGTFRQKLLNYWKECAATGFKDTSMLVASHIKPWRACSNEERLNPFNGLLLTPNLDKAFDSGFITFVPNGYVSLSPLLTEPEKLGITADLRVELTELHEQFMSFHRKNVFRPS
jgi:putative restriction endonuclease